LNNSLVGLWKSLMHASPSSGKVGAARDRTHVVDGECKAAISAERPQVLHSSTRSPEEGVNQITRENTPSDNLSSIIDTHRLCVP